MKRRDNLDQIGALLALAGIDHTDVEDEDRDGPFIDLQSRRAQLARMRRRPAAEEQPDGE